MAAQNVPGHDTERDAAFVVVPADECRTLLATRQLGRIGLVGGSFPLILPVNYVLDGETIVFRTAPGTKLDDGPRAPACFEIDEFNRENRTGWSVLVIGWLEEVTPYDRAWQHVQELPIDPWAAGTKDHVLRLRPDLFTGRRIR